MERLPQRDTLITALQQRFRRSCEPLTNLANAAALVHDPGAASRAGAIQLRKYDPD
jgi:hypothetical protein